MVNQCTVVTSVEAVVSISQPGVWYLDAGLSTPASFPADISTTTTYYTASVGSFNLSVLVFGVQLGGFVSVGFGSAPVITVPTPFAPSGVSTLTPAPSGDTTGVLDTAAIQALEDALSTTGGGVLSWRTATASAPYYITTLTKRSNVSWVGRGRTATVVKQAAATNAPMIKSDSFDALTMTGSNTGGVTGFTITDIAFDGNASNQSVTTVPFVVGIYGYDFRLESVSIRNGKAIDGLYTEWGAFGGAGLPEKSMEPRYGGLRIHDNVLTGAGWRNRGPHDARVSDLLVYNNTTNAAGYWCETTQGTYTVAAGSNGVDVSTFAGAGVLSLSTTLGMPTAASGTVVTGSGTRTVTWTGKTATTLTGVTAVGAGVLSTGGAFTPPSYTGSAALMSNCHVWGNHSYAFLLDCNAKIVNTEAEGANLGQVLVRGGDASWTGGRIFYLSGATGFGVQVGDTTNQATGFMLNDPDMTGFTGVSAATAAVNFVNGASGQYRAKIYQPTGQAIWGTCQMYERRVFTFAGGTTFPSVVANANLGTGAPAATVSNASDFRCNVKMGTGTSPVAGTAATVTFAQPKAAVPLVTIAPANALTAPLQPYVLNVSTTAFSIGFAVAPAASQSAATYEVTCLVDG